MFLLCNKKIIVVETILFWALAILSIASGLAVITNRNPMYSVLLLVINFFCIGGLYLTLNAEFLAVVQIIVYAGAIMVLFLFVVMLLNLGNEQSLEPIFDTKKGLAFLLGLAFLAELLIAMKDFSALGTAKETFDFGKVEKIGSQLMTQYVYPFEMISVILLAALIGALMIAKKHN
jgi:NADH-quinone oxidoreductase subunit J